MLLLITVIILTWWSRARTWKRPSWTTWKTSSWTPWSWNRTCSWWSRSTTRRAATTTTSWSRVGLKVGFKRFYKHSVFLVEFYNYIINLCMVMSMSWNFFWCRKNILINRLRYFKRSVTEILDNKVWNKVKKYNIFRR